MSEHRSALSYTNGDDGIWLTCLTCNKTNPPEDREEQPNPLYDPNAPEGSPSWKTSPTTLTPYWSILGYSPSVKQIVKMWKRHLRGEW